MKKIASVVVTVFLLTTLLIPAQADQFNYTWAEGWDVGTYSYTTQKGVEAEVTKEEAKEGEYSLKIWNKLDKNTRVWAQATGLEPGKSYTASAFIKIAGELPDKAGAILRVSPAYTDGAGKAIGYSSRISTTMKRWTELTATFTVPADTTELAICLDTGIVEKGNAVYWDEVKIKNTEVDINGSFEKIIEIKPEEINIPEGNENLIIDSSFEEHDGTAMEKWNAYQGWKADNPFVSITTEKVRTGKAAIKIESTESGKNPWVSQGIPVQPGTEYLVSVWAYVEMLDKSVTASCGPRMKIEQYSSNEERTSKTALDGAVSSSLYSQETDGWVQLTQKVSSGIECYSLAIYYRFYGAGVVYFDDAEVYQLTEPTKLSLETDWGVYYPDFKTGVAKASANPGLKEENTSVSFAFKDGSTVLKEQEARPLAEEGVEFAFETALMAEMAKNYTVSATLYDTNGNVLEVQEKNVFMFDRSPYIRSDGVYLKNKTTPFYPVFAYHAHGEKHAPYLAEAGINTIQVTFAGNVETLGNLLDVCAEYDIMALVGLYSGMKFAADPANIAVTKEAVEKFKDHPNVFGWMVMDEPFIHGEYNEVVRLLCESYSLIRSIDPEHPVYTLDNAHGTFYETSKYVDILATDPYPTSKRDPATWIATQTVRLRDAARGQKPIYSLVQAYEGGIWPTADQLRSSLYQSLFEGADAIGYYAVGDARKIDGVTTQLYNTDLWPAVKEFKAVDLADDMAFKVFAGNEIPTFNDVRNEQYWYRSWEKDGKLYVVILNRSNEETREAEIKLTSFDGSVTVGSFSGKIIAGGEGEDSGNGVLKATLQPCAAQLWELELSTPVDFSVSMPFTYFDLGDYGWARDAAELMKEKGITYDPSQYYYRPGEKITRGDLAMFLVRSLGLAGAEAENFDDVPADAHYAKDIAIGKAAGILNGVGDNKFNPQAEITRQDMMTIISRGMALTGETDLAAFSDSSLIAEYALSHVKAMISSGLVKGNADGTLNPLGNTTRAEAAVIMQRILNQ
ncbi:MAG: S-layer homology domain-containing protein [Clostridia bacterium]|nr:S-layer homology domain-containing protein [Clostridia bacterium]